MGKVDWRFRTQLATSVGYTGKGTATYPNNDQYKGDFVNGVTANCDSYSWDTVVVNTLTISSQMMVRMTVCIEERGMQTWSLASVDSRTLALESIMVTGKTESVMVKALCLTQIKTSTLATGPRARKMEKAHTLLRWLMKNMLAFSSKEKWWQGNGCSVTATSFRATSITTSRRAMASGHS